MTDLTCGQLLKQYRKATGLTTADIAKKLYLKEQVIASIDADDYTQLQNLTYARGYVRNYAKLVKAPVDEILDAFSRLEWRGKQQADYESFGPAEDKPTLYSGQDHQPIRSLYVEENKTSKRWTGWLLGIVIVLIVVSAIVWWWRSSSAAAATAPATAVTVTTVPVQAAPATAQNLPAVPAAMPANTSELAAPAPIVPVVVHNPATDTDATVNHHSHRRD